MPLGAGAEMLTIQVIAPGATQTFTIDVPANDTIIYRPCAYCDCGVLVKLPRKFCCESHRVMYCKKMRPQ